MDRARQLFAAVALLAVITAGCAPSQTPSWSFTSGGPGASETLGGHTPAPSASGGAMADDGDPSPAPIRPDPNAATYFPRDARAPARPDGTTHDVDLAIWERFMTVADGIVQEVWAFEGTVPGPVIRVQVGDTVRIHLRSRPPKLPGLAALMHPAVNTHPHAVDFHASMDASSEVTLIQPGEEKLYEFKAEKAGVWMYHGAAPPALEEIANGMYGMMIVEPAGGLDPVDQEFFFVQSEWYLGGQYPPKPPTPSLARAAAAVPAPDFVVFNGIANQYRDHPIRIETGKRARAFILDAGPNLDSSFRIEGTTFDRVIKEGIELAVGNAGSWGSQAVDLSPAQGAIVEFTMAEDGLYPIVTHALNVVGRGALGLFQAGDGDPLN